MQKDVRSARATAEALGKALSAHELTLPRSRSRSVPHERRVHVCCDINGGRRVVPSHNSESSALSPQQQNPSKVALCRVGSRVFRATTTTMAYRIPSGVYSAAPSTGAPTKTPLRLYNNDRPVNDGNQRTIFSSEPVQMLLLPSRGGLQLQDLSHSPSQSTVPRGHAHTRSAPTRSELLFGTNSGSAQVSRPQWGLLLSLLPAFQHADAGEPSSSTPGPFSCVLPADPRDGDAGAVAAADRHHAPAAARAAEQNHAEHAEPDGRLERVPQARPARRAAPQPGRFDRRRAWLQPRRLGRACHAAAARARPRPRCSPASLRRRLPSPPPPFAAASLRGRLPSRPPPFAAAFLRCRLPSLPPSFAAAFQAHLDSARARLHRMRPLLGWRHDARASRRPSRSRTPLAYLPHIPPPPSRCSRPRPRVPCRLRADGVLSLQEFVAGLKSDTPLQLQQPQHGVSSRRYFSKVLKYNHPLHNLAHLSSLHQFEENPLT